MLAEDGVLPLSPERLAAARRDLFPSPENARRFLRAHPELHPENWGGN